ncbi:non-ribosomal peptide synthase/polyketide synthase [Paenibacillaceae sp. P-4]|uniref:non-ribosomal peptide synthase/polyketide synthase n=1 Tax=Paenibacillaceae bacterium P-4 TaxID=3160969 RepID=UPI0032E84DB9
MNANPNEWYPLTQAQRRIWYTEMMHPNTSVTTVAGTMYIRGKVDVEILKMAIYQVIMQHDAFRIRIAMTDNQPKQQFAPVEQIVPHVDYLEWDNQIEAESWLHRFNHIPIHMFDPALYHFVVFNVNDEEAWFNLKMNHIVTDGVSSHLIVYKIMKNYTAMLSGNADTDEQESTYLDYIFAEREYEQSDRYAKDKAYWLDKFSTMPEVISIKSYPPHSIGTEASRTSITVSGEMYEKLYRFSQQHDISLFTLFLGSLYAFLYKTTGNNDIAVGAAYANRTSRQDKDALGMFVSTVAARLTITPDQDVLTFLHNVAKEQKAILRHQKYPYNQLILDLREQNNSVEIRDLYRISIDYMPIRWFSHGELAARQRSSFCGHEVDDFAVHVEDMMDDNQIIFNIDYRKQLFEEHEVIRIIDQMMTIVDQMLSNPSQSLQQLSMISDKEAQIILTRFSNGNWSTPQPVGRTIHQLFEEQVERTPDQVAVVFGDRHLTYKELNEQANCFARTLRAHGVAAEQFVGIMADRSIEMVVGILAILKAGGAYVPIDPEYPEERILYMLEDSNARVLVSQSHLQTRLGYTGTWVLLDDENDYEANRDNLESVNEAHHLAYVIYTSGTTGKPKGVMIEHKQITALGDAWKHAYQLDESGIRTLQWASFSFDVFTGDMVRALLYGGELIICPSEARANPEAICELIARHRIHIFESTPALVIPLMEYVHEQGKDVSSLRLLVVGSDHCPAAEYRKLMERFGSQMRILNSYGVTEACVDACYYERNGSVDSITMLPIGKPLPSVSMYILDENKALQPIGIVGELYIGGAGVGRGYLNRDDLTAEKFVDDPYSQGKMYRTGDLARWLPDGNIEYLGRLDHQVKIRGNRIEIGEIETRMLQTSLVREAVIVAREDENGLKALCAYYVADSEISVQQLRSTLAEQVPDYMIPSYFMKLERLPLTPNGKIDRNGLPAPSGQDYSGKIYVEPRNQAEQTLASIWKMVLGVKRVGILDHFFELGGDSIKSIQVSSRMQQAGYKLDIRDLFKYPTIEQISPHLVEVQRKAEQGEESGEVGLTPILRWYFDRDEVSLHHYNQSIMLHHKDGFDEAALRNALHKITEHHDALRMVFRRTEQGEYAAWNRRIEEGELYRLDVLDIKERSAGVESEESLHNMFIAEADVIQAGFDIEAGPLVGAGLFRCPDGDHLLIVIHHAVIDAVSWRILLEDLATGYEQALQGSEIRLPDKTDSFRLWSRQLSAYAQQSNMNEELKYWQQVAQTTITPLPTDYAGIALQRDSESVTVEWNASETELLLKQAHRAYNTQMDDLLLTALGIAFRRWCGHERIRINLEGHGRESILPDLDITRTVGWFTSEYPQLLEVGSEEELPRIIKSVKEVLRSIPNKGIGYGICRYLSDAGMQDDWGTAPEVSFNYLGQFDQDFQNSGFSPSPYSTGSNIGGDQLRPYLLDMNGMVSDGKLQLDISYGRTQYRVETIKRLASLIRDSLLEIIDHCVAKERTELTPSDVSLQRISIQELEQIVERTSGIGEVEDIYALTPMQKGMWFHTAMDSQAGAYFELTRLTLEGTLNIEAFAASWNELAARHAVFRTNFLVDSNGEPLQVVFRSKRISVKYEDWRSLNPNEQAVAIENEAAKERAQGFDLENGDVMRVSVLQTADEVYEVLWISHHIVMDGWCLPLVAAEVFNTYSALVEDKKPILASVPSYNHYIQWLERQDDSAAAAYWNNYLSGFEETTELPHSKGRRHSGQYEAGQVQIDLGTSLSLALNQVATQHQVTLNTLLQASWGILLQKYNRTSDIVFGSVVSGRPAELVGIEEMVGLFINTIPVRVSSQAHERFAEVMTRMQEDALSSAKHDYYPLYEIQAQCTLKQDLITHIMVLENYPMEQQLDQFNSSDGSGLKLTDVTVTEQTNYDLNLIIIPGDNIVIRFDFNKQALEEADMNVLKLHLLHVLEQVASNPRISIGELQLATDEERAVMMSEFNDTFVAYPREKSIHRLFEERAEHEPDALAVVFGNEQMTYGALNAAANRMARRLRHAGVTSGELVGICADRSLDMVVGLLAIMKSGGAYVPIDPAYPQERISAMLEDTSIATMVTQKHLCSLWPEHLNVIVLDVNETDVSNLMEDIESTNLSIDGAGDDLAYIIYTSGSTGTPKGVCVTHRGVVRLVCGATYVEIDSSDVFLQGSTISFDAATFEIWGSLLNGAALAILPPGNVSLTDWSEAIQRHRVTTLWMTAGLFQVMVEQQIEGFYGVKQLLVGGDVVSPTHVCKVMEKHKGIRVINGYGPTENTTFTCCHTITAADLDRGCSIPIGRPISNTRVYVLDEAGNALPVGVCGELYAGGDGLARGYLNRPELTAEKFVNDPFLPGERLYRTGDLARWLPDGSIEFIGRCDEQVKIRGYRIEPGEVLAYLLRVDEVGEAAVIAREDSSGQKELCAYFTAEVELSASGLRETLARELPAYMIPSHFIQIEELPLTPNGKVDRRALPQPGERMRLNMQIQPRTELEAKLALIWKDVLGLENVGVTDSFFELGGHSLRATTLVSKVHRELSVVLPLQDVFRYPTIEQMSLAIQGMHKESFASIPRVEDREWYPVSSAQKRMFVLHQMEGAELSYNMPGVMAIEGKLHRDRLETAFRSLIARHEVLRTGFEMHNGEPMQRIYSDVEFTVEHWIVGAASEAESVIRSFVRAFQLNKPPLLRVGLIEVDAGRHLLLFDMHHIISDGASMGILLDEFVALYSGEQLPELRLQYKDYASWQHSEAFLSKMEEQKAYWLESLRGELPVLQLPVDYTRPAFRSFAGSTLEFIVPANKADQLKQLGAGSDATMYMVLLALYTALLHKYTGQEDVIVGMPIAGRTHADIEPLIGMFVNTLPLRHYPAGEKTFRSFLEEVRQSTLQAYEHQEYPFEELVEHIQPTRDVSRNPIFDTVLVLQNTEKGAWSIDGLAVTPNPIEHAVAKFDLTLHVEEDVDGLACSIEYATALYNRETIERLACHFNQLLEAVISNPEARLEQLGIITETEKQQLIEQFNDTSADYPRDKTIHRLFEEQVERTPDAIAVTGTDGFLTYQELNERANSLAWVLRAEGIGADKLVGIMAERTTDMLVGLIAILKAGGAYVPIDPEYPDERISYMLSDSGADILLLPRHLQNQVAYEGTVLFLDDEQTYSGDKSNPPSVNKPSDLAYVIYTSGTTGKPKGTLIEHKNVVRLLFNSRNLFDFRSTDTWTLFHSFCFDFSVWEMYGALLYGGKLVVVPQLTAKNPAMFLQLLAEERVTILNQTPTYFYQLIREALTDGSPELNIRMVIFGGEALSPQLLKDWRAKYPRTQLINMYGITETTVHVTYKEITETEIEQARSNIGFPIPTLRIYILDANRQCVPIGVAGEMFVAGEGLARGYLNRPELTADRFVDNPFEPGSKMYKTGDLAKWLPDGNIEYLGRIDHQVKIRGYRIELGEVEAQVTKVESVREAIVIAREENGEKLLCAYFVADRQLTVGEMRTELAQELPAYMIPSYFVQMERMPLTSNGKVDRKALPAPEGSINTGKEYVAPRTPMEASLARMWEELLGIEQVGVTDNFFELGGHSLRATALVNRVHQEMNIQLPLRDVFRFSTIEELAAAMSEMAEESYSSIPVAEAQDHYPVSSAQKRLYILHQLEGAEQGYNMPGIMLLEGELDRSRFEAAFRKLIARHDILRTGFELVQGEAVQRIHDTVDFAIEYRKVEEQEVQQQVKQFIRTFELDKPPLLRVGLIEIAETKEQHVLLFDMHHIISDGVSIGIVLQEIMRHYHGEQVPPLHIQYKDYAAWQQSEAQKEQLRHQQAYWLDQFQGELPILELPTDYARPAMQQYGGLTLPFRIDKDVADGLNRIAADTGTTLYMVLLAAYTVMLHKYTGQEDIVVGTPIAGRTHEELQPLIGMFVNTLAIRAYPAGAKAFRSYLDEIRSTMLGAYEHQQYPFEELVEGLQLTRDLSRNPLFDTMFALDNTDMKADSLGELQMKPYPLEYTISKFDVSLDVKADEAGLDCSFEYATSLFKSETIHRMAEHFSQLLKDIVNHPDAQMGELGMLTVQESDEILQVFNPTRSLKTPDGTIHRLFEEQAERTPEQPAVVFGNKRMTYRELNERANKLARTLRAEGVESDDLIGVMADRSIDMVVAVMAVLKSGGAYVPIDPEYPEDRIRYMLEDAKARILLTQCHLQDKVSFEGTWVLLEDEASYHEDDTNLEPNCEPDHLCYVIYTSGTTGNPKGVMIEHRQLAAMAEAWKAEYELHEPGIRWLQWASFSFDVFSGDLARTLLHGGELVLCPSDTRANPGALAELLRSSGIQMFESTPALVIPLMEHVYEHRMDIDSLKLLIIGSDLCPADEFRKLLDRFGSHLRIINSYGVTEACVDSSYYEPISSDPVRSVPIGKPLPYVSMYILGENLSLQPVGLAGELYIAGAGVGRGYWNRPEMTADKFVRDPFADGQRMYRTGDLAKWLPDGNIELIGRTDHQVKIRGYRIEIGEVESKLQQTPHIREAAVVAKEDGSGRKVLCAYYTSERELTAGEWRAALAKELPAYMIPSHFMRLERMPLTPNGKLDRKGLPAPEGAAYTGTEYEAPRTDAEIALAAAWQSVLHVERVGTNDHFFELGGDSIKSIQVSSRLHQAGYKLEIRDLFKYPTIAQLSLQLQPIGRIADQGEVSGEAELTPIQRWYFGLDLDDMHHYNQSFMLYRQDGFNEEVLRKTLRTIVEHHDALRMVFRKSDAGVTAWNRAIEEGELFDFLAFDIANSGDAEQVIEAKANDIQASIDLQGGPLVKAGLFRCEQGHHLLIAIHHAVIDGVSWRILLEDIAAGYEQACKGDDIRLPSKTDSYAAWSRSLVEYAEHTDLGHERSYWRHVLNAGANPLPKDFDTESSLQQDSNSVTVAWDQQDTEHLLKRVHRAYNTDMNEILLAALAIAIQKWSGHNQILVNLEGHGREPIAGDLDISRTVGWFTSEYPVLLQAEQDRGLAYHIKRTKEELRQIPNKGIGYGICRYLSEPQDSLEWGAAPEISFNYLGQFVQDSMGSGLMLSPYSKGSDGSALHTRQYVLDINGAITDGILTLDMSYSEKEYRKETMELLAGHFHESLLEIIDHCVSREQTELTPSDLLLQGLSIEQLEQIAEETKELGIIENMYMLTPMQKGMWFHNALDGQEGASGAYFEQTRFTLRGELEPVLFAQSLHELAARHSVLRTNFCSLDGEPVQVVFREGRITFTYEDLSQLPADEQAVVMERVVASDKLQGFDLERDPLVRVTLMRTEASSCHVLWSSHHILMDGWCLPQLTDELFRIYSAVTNHAAGTTEATGTVGTSGSAGSMWNKEANLPDYSRYIEWLAEQDMSAAAEYWNGYLAGYEQQTRLPNGKITGKDKPYVLEQASRKLGIELTSRMIRIAKQHQVTLNTLLQAAWGIVLQKYNGTQDVVFGGVVSGRPADVPGVESMIGLFINTIPVRVSCEAGASFSDVMEQLQNAALESGRYDYYPLYEIQSRTSQKSELISHIMVFENYPLDERMEQTGDGNDGALALTDVQAAEQTNYDFNLMVVPGDELIIRFDFNSEVYDRGHMERLHHHLMHVLEQVTGNPAISIAEVQLATEAEKAEVQSAFNDTAVDYPREQTIHRMFEEQVQRTPDAAAVLYGDDVITYRELNERANRLARTLRAAGVEPDQIVGIMAERSLELMVGIMGILKAGGAYVPIAPDYPEDRIRYMLDDSKAQVLLVQGSAGEAVDFAGRIINLDDAEAYDEDGSNPEPVNKPTDIAYIIYTSGTTGRPKGVMVEHTSVINRLLWMQKRYPIGSEDTIMQKTAITFDVSVWELFWWAFVGSKVLMLSVGGEKNPHAIVDAIERHRITTMHFVPSMLHAFLEHVEQMTEAERERGLAPLRQVFTSGEALLASQVERFHRYIATASGAQLINLYGPTEATVDVTYFDCEPGQTYVSVPIGKPIDNTSIYIVNEHNQVQPIGVAGELCIAGVGLARGYWNRPELTAEKFVTIPSVGERMYRTGDLARWLPDGNIEYLGRIDHQVKIRGYRIELGELETALLNVQEIRETVVVAREEEDGQKSLCAYYVADGDPTVGNLRAALAAELPSYMIPSYFIQLEQMPLAPNGKLDRKALPAPKDVIQTGTDHAAPRTALEVKLVRIWQEVLGLDQIGVKDDFFELGGHSLRATALASKVSKEMHVALPLRDIFHYSTLEAMAQAIGELEKQEHRAIPIAPMAEHYPLASAQKRLYILHQAEGAQQSYNMPGAMSVSGHIDRNRLEAALLQLITRHDTLRTSFEMVDGEPVQRVHQHVDFALEYSTAREKDIDQVTEQFVRDFDLEQPPLLRVGLVQLEQEEQHLLLFDMHHIISDGISMDILVDELARLYNGEELPPLEIQYKDYVLWQQGEASSEQMKEHEEYWLRTLGNELPLLELPTEFARGEQRSYEGDKLHFAIDGQLNEKLQRLASQSGATLYMVLLAAYTTLLHKYSGQNDLVVGSPIAGRTHVDVEPLIGMFVNSLAIRNYPNDDKTFRSYLEEVKESTLSAFEHQDYPFDKLVEQLEDAWVPGRNPVFDTMFVLQNAKARTINLGELAFEPLIPSHTVAKFDLTLEMAIEDGMLSGQFEYCTKLFSANMIANFAEDFLEILSQACEQPDIRLEDIQLSGCAYQEEELEEEIDFAF